MSLVYSFFKLLGVCLFLSIFVIQPSFAQGSGTIKGQVVDQVTGESLVGANVTIENTSIGNAADLDGNFILRLVPAGKWTLKVSYVGYKPITLDVTVADNATVEQNFRLVPQTISGEEVIVTAQARGQVQAINQQLGSDKIVNVVSEARIQELPDFNAAAAISRLPGVSTLESSGEANKVVIRGLAPKYNNIAIGGISLASTGSSRIGAASQIADQDIFLDNDRSTDLTMVTPYMIKSIEVYKSLTPDMNANAIGGFVNMELREAPSGLHTDLMWQSGYTAKTEKYGNYRTLASISNRFLEDALGVYLLINAEKYDRDADDMQTLYTIGDVREFTAAGYHHVQVTEIHLNRHIETRERLGGNLILDYKLPNGIIRSVNMFSRLNADTKDYYQRLNLKNNWVDFRFKSGLNTTDAVVNSLEFEYDFGFMSAQVKAANAYSMNSLPDAPFYQLRQTGTVSGQTVDWDTPPENLIAGVVYRGPAETYLNNISKLSSQFKEVDRTIKGDFKVPYSITDNVSGYIKFGGVYQVKEITNDQSTPYADIDASAVSSNTIKRRIVDGIIARYPQVQYSQAGTMKFQATSFTSTSSKLTSTFLGDKFGKFYWACDPTILNGIVNYVSNTPDFNGIYSSAADPGGWTDGVFQNLPSDYDYTERYSAAYLMSNLNIGQEIMLVGGVRYEQVISKFHVYNMFDNRDVVNQRAVEDTKYPENHFWLPMVQVKYTPFGWGDVRYSYSQTLARSDYSELSPHYTISYDHNTVRSGNPKLKPAQAYNHDLIVTVHSNELGLASIGAFYKTIDNFTYSTSYKLREHPAPGLDSIGNYSSVGTSPNAGATLYTYMNGSEAIVKGVEFDLQTRFWYLPFPLDGLLLGLNYSHIWSETKYPRRDEISTPNPNWGQPGEPRYLIVVIDSLRTGRLLNQPNDIANAFIGYDYKGFSAKVSLVYIANAVSLIQGYSEQDAFTDDYFRVDLSVRQMLPIEGLQLFLDVTNLNNRNNISRQITIGGFTNEKNYGLTANLGVRFTHAFQ